MNVPKPHSKCNFDLSTPDILLIYCPALHFTYFINLDAKATANRNEKMLLLHGCCPRNTAPAFSVKRKIGVLDYLQYASKKNAGKNVDLISKAFLCQCYQYLIEGKRDR